MHPRLSARQEQCLRLTAFRTDKEIAAHLGISEATVKKHVHEACQRLGVNRRKAALALLDPIVPEAAEKPVSVATVGYPKQPMALPGAKRDAFHQGEQGFGERDGQARSASFTGRPDGHPAGQDAIDGRVVSTGPGSWEGDPRRGRLGYRVPPGSPVLRLVLIVVLTIVLAALVVTVVVMLGDMHEAVGKIDAATAG